MEGLIGWDIQDGFPTHMSISWPGILGTSGGGPGISLPRSPFHIASLGFLIAWWTWVSGWFISESVFQENRYKVSSNLV